MYFRQFHDTTSAAMSYLIADTASRVAAAIDPTPAPCQGLVLKALLAERGFSLALIGGVAMVFDKYLQANLSRTRFSKII